MQQGFKVTLVYIVVTNFALWKLAVLIMALASTFEGKTRNNTVTHINIKIVIVITIIVSSNVVQHAIVPCLIRSSYKIND